MRNAFEALCELAGREHWCWKIPCTTCGNAHFRIAVREIVNGKHPDDASWDVYQDQPDKWATARARYTARDFQDRLSLAMEKSLQSVLAGASLSCIAHAAPFPDWLGYLGQGLFWTQWREARNRMLTLAWGEQLFELSGRPTHLRAIIDDPKRILYYGDLQSLERAILPDFVHRKPRRDVPESAAGSNS